MQYFDIKISKKFLRERAMPPHQTPHPVGRGTPPPHTPSTSAPRLVSGAFGARPAPNYNTWIRLWYCPVFILGM